MCQVFLNRGCFLGGTPSLNYHGVVAMTAAEKLALNLEASDLSDVVVIGPAPCPVDRVRNRWRWHLLVKATNNGPLTRIGHYFAERIKVPSRGELRVVVDRDPVSLL